jgi:hypothetical protein
MRLSTTDIGERVFNYPSCRRSRLALDAARRDEQQLAANGLIATFSRKREKKKTLALR